MDKKYIKTITAVVLGIAVVLMVFSLFSLIFDSCFMDDAILLNGSTDTLSEILTMVKWMTVSLVCVLTTTFVCYVFTYFSNGKIFSIVSAVLSLFITVTCVAFIFVLRGKALDANSATIYSAVLQGFEAFIVIAVSSLIICVFFVFNSIMNFKKKPANTVLAETSEVQSNEEV